MAEDLLIAEQGELYAVASRNAEKAQDFGLEFGAEKCYHNYQALCEDPQVDIVYIATPHSFHYEHASLAIEAGKAVLVEKPMGLNAVQSAKLIAKARDKGVFLMEGIWTRFMPITEKLMELLEAKVLGDLEYLAADFGFRSRYEPDHRLFNPDLGGGSLLDIGIYPLYLSLVILGEASEMKVNARYAPNGVDKYCKVELNYEGGAKAELISSFEENLPTEAILKGSKGSIQIHRRFHQSEKLSLDFAPKLRDIQLPYLGNGYVHEIDEVHLCLDKGLLESPKLTLDLSLRLSKNLDRIIAKMQS